MAMNISCGACAKNLGGSKFSRRQNFPVEPDVRNLQLSRPIQPIKQPMLEIEYLVRIGERLLGDMAGVRCQRKTSDLVCQITR